MGDFKYPGASAGGSGFNRLDTAPSNIPTNPQNPSLTVCMDWTDINTIKWIYNGEVVRIRHVTYEGTYNEKGYDVTPPPPQLV